MSLYTCITNENVIAIQHQYYNIGHEAILIIFKLIWENDAHQENNIIF